MQNMDTASSCRLLLYYQGLRLRRILRILVFTDKYHYQYQALRIYTKPVRFVYGKISCKNPLVKRMKQRVRLVNYKKKDKKKAPPSNELFLMFH